ncbi:6-phosphogluconolactonase [Temperatibacter marinus]|uniref:6-phosphogluconolactonase n=1 Tax=Temperatibacter marinus TaxID=1456591 RepID=A0AA52EJ01_9PROT|nr:6-phosphogluconolactonase [Temperatibacter marinus]WND03164.1 6-phosphogluconolactonase [Temperatibacter marinus]
MYILKKYETREEMVVQLAQDMITVLEESVDTDGQASWAVSGGNTPKPLFHAMRETDLAWDDITVSLVDDRWVPESHPRSNAAMIKQELLQGKAKQASFLTLYREGKSPFDCADDVNKEYEQQAIPFSSILLGMGPDGHTASLFPKAKGLEEAFHMEKAPTISPIEAIQSPVTGDEILRLSLSARAISQCNHIRMMLTGPEKLEALEQATAEGSDLPIARLMRVLNHPLTIYYAD